MTAKKCIALIPAYEPAKSLLSLLYALNKSGFETVVVDDGSGASYAGIFRRACPLAKVISYKQNKGKGHALKTGLAYIRSHFKGPYVVVTLDADGQHKVSDVLKACLEAKKHPLSLVLGSRELKNNVPFKSRFGNTATRIAFFISTRQHIHDTQTGLRAFDSRLIPLMLKIKGARYEYEMNMLLECARKKIPIRQVTIQTIYINNNAGSHFNAIKDSWLIYKAIFKFTALSIKNSYKGG